MRKQKRQYKREFLKKSEFYFEIAWWFLNNKKIIKTHDNFDYPDYGGMPTGLSNNLSSLTVDIIQDNWDTIKTSKSLKYLTELFLV